MIVNRFYLGLIRQGESSIDVRVIDTETRAECIEVRTEDPEDITETEDFDFEDVFNVDSEDDSENVPTSEPSSSVDRTESGARG